MVCKLSIQLQLGRARVVRGFQTNQAGEVVFLHLKDHGTYLEIIIKMDNSWIPCWPSVVTVVAQRLSPARELPHVAGAAPPQKWTVPLGKFRFRVSDRGPGNAF